MILRKILVPGLVILVGLGVAVPAVALVMRARAANGAPPAEASAPVLSAVCAEGRVVTYPGHQVSLSAEIVGTIQTIHVKEGDRVKKGDVLVDFRRGEQQASLAEAWARVGEAETQLKFASAEAKRARALAASSSIPIQTEERSLEERNSARARRRAAGAATQRLQEGLAKTKVVAPIDGIIISRMIEPGETVGPGAPLLGVADFSALRVEAEIDEFDAMRVKLGMPVKVSVDGSPGDAWEGQVEEIPSVVVPRRIRPHDPARATDSRVLLVKVTLPAGTPLKLGQRVNLSLTLDVPVTPAS